MASLKLLSEEFGRQNMTVLHYDAVANHIDAAFLMAIGLQPDKHDFIAISSRVNRSLTDYEQQIISRLNQAAGNQYSLELSTLLITKNRSLMPATQISSDIIQILMLRHAADIKWLNHTFFDDLEEIKIIDAGLNRTSAETLSDSDKQAIDREIADWCLSKLQTAKEDFLTYTIKRLAEIDRENAGNPAVPANFDPYAYLFLNLDIFYNAIPPYQHFIDFGRHEHGRQWRWPEQ
ncbi:MAG: hypothetical protein PHW13_00980 [Methylococcales bacterium]|nr:hypothetical protein [Methylococcales bacterium]